MKGIAALWLFIFFIFLNAAAQAPADDDALTQTVRGVVVDNQSRSPLFGANVSLIDGSRLAGAMTDEQGHFKISKVSIGRHDLKVSYLGYEDYILSELAVTSGKEVVLNIGLTESVKKLDEIVVAGKLSKPGQPINSMATVSARSFSTEQSERFAASVNDPARLALSFAGVKGEDDLLNGIIVRGNAPKYVLWRIEGVEVPSPNHFTQEGYGGGALSMLSSAVLSASDFYSGAFPAEFGNVASAIFDLRLRKGNNEKREYSLQAGMLGFEGSMEGPFTRRKTSSYLVNYRYSTLRLFDKIGFYVGNSITTYQDVNFKLNFPTKKAGEFSVFGVGGLSNLTVDAEKNNGQEDVNGYDMGVIGLAHSYTINSKNHIRTVLAFSANREKSSSSYIDRNRITFPLYHLQASNLFGKGSVQVNTKFSAKSSMRYGIIISSVNFALEESWGSATKTSIYEANGNSYYLQAYSQWKYRFNDAVHINYGLHFIYFGLNKHYNIEPRLGLVWKIKEKHSLNFGAGIYSRLENLAFYSVEKPSNGEPLNANLDLMKALHLAGGYEVFPLAHLRVKAEIFFQYLYDVPVRNKPNSSFSTLNFTFRYPTSMLENTGNGMNYGIELTLEKTFAHNYYILANGTLFNSKYRAGDRIWRNTRYNANFITSLTAGKDFVIGKFHKNHVIGLNLRVLWSGGERTEASEYRQQIANYFRLDTRVSYTRNKKRYSWQFSVDIQNATNRLNENQLEDIKPTGIVPVANYKVTF